MRRSLWLILLMLGARTALAQRVRVPRSDDPVGWGMLSAGYMELQRVVDGTTQTAWDFGSTVQYRAALEYPIANQATIGVMGSFARAPLRYYGGPACDGCDAHADIWGGFASFHIGGTRGFHQVLELNLGAVYYTRFRTDGGGAPLAPNADADFAFEIGYGFGYGISPQMQIELVQDLSAALHQRENLPANANARTQQYTTRLALRYGLGRRRAVR